MVPTRSATEPPPGSVEPRLCRLEGLESGDLTEVTRLSGRAPQPCTRLTFGSGPVPQFPPTLLPAVRGKPSHTVPHLSSSVRAIYRHLA